MLKFLQYMTEADCDGSFWIWIQNIASINSQGPACELKWRVGSFNYRHFHTFHHFIKNALSAVDYKPAIKFKRWEFIWIQVLMGLFHAFMFESFTRNCVGKSIRMWLKYSILNMLLREKIKINKYKGKGYFQTNAFLKVRPICWC